MRYTVVWVPAAEQTLANIWNHAADKDDITDATYRIDTALANDPETKGKPFRQFWVRNEPPLAVLYEIIPDDRMVRVLTVKRI